MLVLSRQSGEGICIGDDIVVTVVRVSRRSGHVRIGIEAPRSVPVYRDELKQERTPGNGEEETETPDA